MPPVVKKTFIQDFLDRIIAYVSGLAWKTFVDWLRNMPIITKVLVFVPLLLAFLVDYGMIQENILMYNWLRVRQDFELWRFVSPFLYAGRFSSGQLIPHLFFMQHHCSNYERKPYDTGAGGGSADFLWMIILAVTFLTIAGSINTGFNIQNSNQTLLYVVLYIWSKRMTETFTIFGFNVVPTYLPLIRIAYDLIGILAAGGSIMSPLLGIAFGYAYVWLVVQAPHQLGRRIIVTPKAVIFLLSLYASSQVTVISTSSKGNNPPSATIIAVSQSSTATATAGGSVVTGTIIGVQSQPSAPSAPKSMLASIFGSDSIKSSSEVGVVVAVQRVSKRGWLKKQTNWTKWWKRRYVVLEDKTLVISENDVKEGKVMIQHPHHVLKAVVPCDMKGTPHVLCVMISSGDIYLQCASAEERSEWIAALKTLIP